MPGTVPLPAEDRRNWGIAGAVATVLHTGAIAAVLFAVVPTEHPVPEPVVLVELPPEAAPAPAVAAEQPVAQPQPDYVPPQVLSPPIKAPPVNAPMPKDPVSLPPPPPRRVAPMAATAPAVTNAVAVSPTGAGTGSSSTPGTDPKARAQEADYYSLISAHLNRKKRYPTEAKKARQQGVVTVRFTVDRDGGVSGVSIKRGSGHDILDQATLELLQRVAPLPRMPAAMKKDSVTLSLPIDYSLKTD